MVLWDECFARVAAEFPNIATESLLIDRAVMEFVRRPESFDVVVVSNLFGRHPSMFEPVHGSAPDITGKGIANPLAAILSVAMMFEHLHLDTDAASIHQAVKDLLASSGPRTPDLGGTARTEEVGQQVAAIVSRS